MSELDQQLYLYLAALLFSSGLFVVLSKRNAVFVLIGIEQYVAEYNQQAAPLRFFLVSTVKLVNQ